MRRPLITSIVSLVFILTGLASVCFAAHYPDPVPSPYAVTLSGAPRVVGEPLAAGDELAAFSVHPKPAAAGKWEKTLVGRAVVTAPGAFSVMTVYGDDPATDNVVEGCIADEEILLVIRKASTGIEYTAWTTPEGDPGNLRWTTNGDTLDVTGHWVEGQRIPLRTGAWNLVSSGVLKGYRLVSGALPANLLTPGGSHEIVPGTTLTEAFPLKSIQGQYDRVIGSDGSGTRLLRDTDTVSGLKVISPGYGYWVKTKPSNRKLIWMTFPGPLATGEETLQLSPGAWTLVGHWGNERIYHDSTVGPFNQLVPVGATDNAQLSKLGDVWSTIDGQYDRAIMADGTGTRLWNPAAGSGNFRYLAPGYGYWLKMRDSGMLRYPDFKPPEGLAASPGNAQVALSWASVAGAREYRVYRATDLPVGRTNPVAAVPDNAYLDEGLENGRFYYFIVTAMIGGTETAPSGPVGSAPLPPPGAPVAAADPGDSRVTVSWDDVPDATSYRLNWSIDAGLTNATGTRLDNVASPVVVDNLVNGTTCFFVVTAINAAGESPGSAVVSARPAGPPPAPVITSAVAGNARVTVSWGPVADATAYRIYWAAGDNVSKSTGTLVDNAASGRIVDSLENGRPYAFVVTALNTGGESSESPVVTATPVAPPGAPDNVSVVAGDSVVTVGWGAVPDASGYRVCWSTNPDSTLAAATCEDRSSSPWPHTGRVNGTTYYYSVTAWNPGGDSPASARLAAMPGRPAPGAVSGVSVSAGNGSATLSWSGVPGATGYRIYRAQDNIVTRGNATRIDDVAGTSLTQGAAAWILNGRTYSYLVTALNLDRESPDSAVVSARPQLPRTLAAPALFTAYSRDGEILLTWSAVAGATGYRVYWDNGSSANRYSGNILNPGAGTSFRHLSLNNGRRYSYVVSAFNAVGESGDSQEIGAVPGKPIPGVPAQVATVSYDGQVNVSFCFVSGASYNIYWGTSPVIPRTAANRVTVNPNGFVANRYEGSVTGLQNGVRYYFVVTAVAGSAESADSPVVSAVPGAPILGVPYQVDARPSDNAVTLGWGFVSGAEGYYVYWSEDPSVPMTPANRVHYDPYGFVTNRYSTVVSNLKNDVRYYFVVTGESGSAESRPSDVISAVPGAAAAGIPAGMYISAGDNAVSLSWSAVPGATEYRVRHSAMPDEVTGGTAPVDSVTATGKAYSTLGAGLWNYFAVTAVVGGVESGLSRMVGAAPGPYRSGVPHGLTATSADNAVWIRGALNPYEWIASDYRVYYSTDPDITPGGSNYIAASRQNMYDGMAVPIPGIANGTDYYLAVSTVSRSGLESPLSPVFGVKPDRYRSGVPVEVSAKIADNAIRITGTLHPYEWAASEFRVYHSTNPGITPGGANFVPATRDALANGTFYVRNLAAGTRYWFAVSTVSASGLESPLSPEVWATPGPVTAPGSPASLTVASGDGQVRLDWAPGGATGDTVTGYTLYRSNAPGVPTLGNPDKRSLGNVLTYTDTPLPNDNAVYYVVTAVTSGGESGASPQASAAPKGAQPPTAPVDVGVSKGTGGTTLAWSATSGATSYNVYWSTLPGVTKAGGPKASADSPRWDHGDPLPGTAYHYAVAAVNGTGEGPLSTEVAVPATGWSP